MNKYTMKKTFRPGVKVQTIPEWSGEHYGIIKKIEYNMTYPIIVEVMYENDFATSGFKPDELRVVERFKPDELRVVE